MTTPGGEAGPSQVRIDAIADGGAQQFIAGHDQTIFTGPVPPPVPAMRTLPRVTAAFTGRDRELRLLDAAAAGAAGVVAIHIVDGMPGVGKTALVTRAAHLLAGAFPDGQLFVDLHAHTPGMQPADPCDVLADLLACTGMSPREIPDGLDARAERWRDRLAGQKVLLVLDDAAGHAQVEPLLPATAGCMVLISSRRRLVALADAQPVTLNVLQADDAAHLYVRLAGRAGLLPDDEAVSEIAALCGHLPLAISLTASQLRHHGSWTIAHQAAELAAAKDRLAMMVAEDLSVAAAFDLSYRKLTSDQQLLFRRLGLHPGTTVDAYSAAALGGLQLAAARSLLDDLFGYHLIEEPSQGRYRLHDLVRERARSLAAADPAAERDAAVDRLLSYYLSTARAADRHLARRTSALTVTTVTAATIALFPDMPTRNDAVSWFDAERLNLNAVASHATDNDMSGSVVAIAAAMDGYLRARGHWDQARVRQQAAIEAARDAGDRLGEASGLADLGALQTVTGNNPEAIANITRSLDLYRSLGNRQGEANAVHNLGKAQDMAGDTSAAIANFMQALDWYHNLGDSLGLARTHLELGNAKQAIDIAAAIASFMQALELYSSLGNLDGQASSYTSLGTAQSRAGDLSSAIANSTRALDLYRGLGNPQGEALSLGELGACQAYLGDYQAACASLGEAAELARGLHDRRSEGILLGYLGVVQLTIDDYPAALASQTRLLEISRDFGEPNMQASALAYLGSVQLAMGDYTAALASEQEAADIFSRLGQLHGRAGALAFMGSVQLAMGDYTAALASEQEAVDIFSRLGDPHGQATALGNLGAVQREMSEYLAASASLSTALGLFRGAGDPHGEAEVLNNMGELELVSPLPGKACSFYEEAHAIAARISSPLQEARALEGIGRCYLQQGLPDDGTSHLRQALAIYRRIGSPRTQRVETTLDDYDP